jgi:hypothetical protein
MYRRLLVVEDYVVSGQPNEPAKVNWQHWECVGIVYPVLEARKYIVNPKIWNV